MWISFNFITYSIGQLYMDGNVNKFQFVYIKALHLKFYLELLENKNDSNWAHTIFHSIQWPPA